MIFRNALLAASLTLSSVALAQDGHDSHGAHDTTTEQALPGGHVDADHGTGDHHAEAVHGSDHEGDHGGGHGDHHDPTDFYMGDMDGDGTINWLDSSYDGVDRDFWTLFMDADDPYMVPDLAFHALHIFLLVVLLFLVGRRPIGDALKNRALGIRKELVDAARERDEARQRNEELVARLGAFERELQQMRADAAEDAKRDAEHLAARAEAEAKRIQESAERSIADEVRRAKASLRKEAVDVAVSLAEATLSKEVQADDQRRLARQFLDTLKTDGDSAHG